MRKWMAFFLAMLLIGSLMPASAAADRSAQDAAETLHSLGLLQGVGTLPDGSPDFDLDHAVTRAEAVVMLVRLLGGEPEARNGRWNVPFSDVAQWALPYVGYAYTHRLTEGIGGGKFGGQMNVTATQYLTFVLRALGYESGTDFQWDRAWEKTNALGITDRDYAKAAFTRGDMAEISLSALSAKLKNQDQTLGESLGLGDMAPEEGVQLTPLRYANGEYRWDNTFHLYNDTDDTLRLVSLSIQHRMGGANGELVNEVVFLEDRLPEIHLGDPEHDTLTLSPGEEHVWSDGHPLVDFFDAMVYIFTFRDQSGQNVVRTFRFNLSHELPEIRYPDYSNDHGRDLATLRYDADFEVKVSDGVYWVPARTLGDSRYTNAEVQAMLTLSPEEKQAKIGTLYEALQFYQIGAFAASNDNIRIPENGVDWEHHKPGYHAVRTNTGCCATDSNWLRYLLDSDYDEVGFIATSQRDGSGHIYNYILQDGWYYIIDLTHYRTDWVATAIEDGTMESYWSSDRVLGNIHKVQDISKFVDYVQEAFQDPPGLMFMYTAENCLAIDGKRSADGSCVIIYEAVGREIQTVIFDDPTDRLTLRYDPAPKNLPDWAAEESFDFTKIAK